MGTPKYFKTDNARTEVGTKWTEYCCKYLIQQKVTEPHSPRQNLSESAINDLGQRATRCHKNLYIPFHPYILSGSNLYSGLFLFP